MANKIQIRRDTTANWTANNPILAVGEIGINVDTNDFKIGNGTSNWNTLSYTLPQDASETVKGIVELATAGESAAGLAVQANDPRLSDARTPTTHTHTKAQITDFAHNHTASDITDFNSAVTTNSAVAANTAKVTNATHTGDVTGATTLTLSSSAITGKTTVVGEAGDFVLISDTSDSGNLKKVDVTDFLGGGGGGGGTEAGTGANSLKSNIGTPATASGDRSIALGHTSIASGSLSTVLGSQSSATQTYDVALGAFAAASGASSVAVGGSTTASGSGAAAIGYNAQAIGAYSNALGVNSKALAPYSIALGSNSISRGESVLSRGLATQESVYEVCWLYRNSDLVADVTGAEIYLAGTTNDRFEFDARLSSSMYGFVDVSYEVYSDLTEQPSKIVVERFYIRAGQPTALTTMELHTASIGGQTVVLAGGAQTFSLSWASNIVGGYGTEISDLIPSLTTTGMGDTFAFKVAIVGKFFQTRL